MFRQFWDWAAGREAHGFSCVGLIVVLGAFSFLVTPDENFMPPRASAPGAKSAPPEQQPIAVNGPPTVVIDPGHGGIDDGTAYFGLAEKNMTLDVAQRLERILHALRIETVLTRHDDIYVSLPDRAELANRVADTNTNVIFVSIHFNQSAVESVDGIETYYADKKIPPPNDWTWIGFFDHPDDLGLDRGANLAADIQSAVVGQMSHTNRGIKSRSLFVTRHTRMPAVLVEGGFLSNKLENQLLRNDSYRERIAQGIASGIVTYFQTAHPAIPLRMATASSK
jgi:N-acetylmuramoyl-L-alanine amidase